MYDHVVSAGQWRWNSGGRLPRGAASHLEADVGACRVDDRRYELPGAGPVRRTDVWVPRDGRDTRRARRPFACVGRRDRPRPVDAARTTHDAAGVRCDEEIVSRVVAAADWRRWRRNPWICRRVQGQYAVDVQWSAEVLDLSYPAVLPCQLFSPLPLFSPFAAKRRWGCVKDKRCHSP